MDFWLEKVGHRKVLVSLYLIGVVTFLSLSVATNVTLVYLLIFLGGASTVGVMNLGNPYITEYYPREIRATGMGYAQAIGRTGSILAPTLIAMLLVTGVDPKLAFAAFAIPSILAAIGFAFVQEKYGSFDKVVEEENRKESMKVGNI